jgi:hypothetical protein
MLGGYQQQYQHHQQQHQQQQQLLPSISEADSYQTCPPQTPTASIQQLTANVEAIQLVQQEQQQGGEFITQNPPAAATAAGAVSAAGVGNAAAAGYNPDLMDRVDTLDLESFMPDDPSSFREDTFGSLSGLPPWSINSNGDLSQQQQLEDVFGVFNFPTDTTAPAPAAASPAAGDPSDMTLVIGQQQGWGGHRAPHTGTAVAAGSADGPTYSAPAALIGTGNIAQQQQQQQQQQGYGEGWAGGGLGGGDMGPSCSGPAAIETVATAAGAGQGGGAVVSTASYGDLQAASAAGGGGGGGDGAGQQGFNPNTEQGVNPNTQQQPAGAAGADGFAIDSELVDQLLADIEFDEDFAQFLAEDVPGQGDGGVPVPPSGVSSAVLDLGGLSDMLVTNSEAELLQGSRFHQLCRDFSFRRNDSLLGLRAMSGLE